MFDVYAKLCDLFHTVSKQPGYSMYGFEYVVVVIINQKEYDVFSRKTYFIRDLQKKYVDVYFMYVIFIFDHRTIYYVLTKTCVLL